MSEGRFSRKLRIVLVVIYKYRFSKFLSRLKFHFANLYRGEYVETAVDPSVELVAARTDIVFPSRTATQICGKKQWTWHL